jgi:hypothetical protein
LLSGLGNFTVGSAECWNDAHIVATDETLSTLTDGTLSNWSCSVHETFDSWPPSYQVLAIAENTEGGTYQAPDGTHGSPYIMSRGADVISDIDLAPLTATNPVGTTHTLNATVTHNAVPVVGATVTFTAVSGPDAGPLGSAVTNAAGVATISYVGIAPGEDYINATYTPSGGALQTSNVVTADWTIKTKCATANSGTDAGRGASAQNKYDLGYWTHAADDFSCQAAHKVHVRKFTFAGRYSSGVGPVDKFRVFIRSSDPAGSEVEPKDFTQGLVCSYVKNYTVSGNGPVYNFKVTVPPSQACALTPGKTYWLIVQAQMKSTAGEWEWELQSGPASGNDADWKTIDPHYGPGTCDTYSQTGGPNPGADRDLEDCLGLGETGAPDLLFTVS